MDIFLELKQCTPEGDCACKNCERVSMTMAHTTRLAIHPVGIVVLTYPIHPVGMIAANRSMISVRFFEWALMAECLLSNWNGCVHPRGVKVCVCSTACITSIFELIFARTWYIFCASKDSVAWPHVTPRVCRFTLAASSTMKNERSLAHIKHLHTPPLHKPLNPCTQRLHSPLNPPPLHAPITLRP